MRKAVATSLILVIAVGLVLSVVGSVVAQWLLTHVLKVSEDILADATAYFAIYCFGWCSSLPITSCPLFFGPWEIRRPHYISCWCHR